LLFLVKKPLLFTFEISFMAFCLSAKAEIILAKAGLNYFCLRPRNNLSYKKGKLLKLAALAERNNFSH
jgi:hypothetical protein